MNLEIKNFVTKALIEDIGRGDLFSLCSNHNKKQNSFIISKQNGVLSGIKYIEYLCKVAKIKYNILKKDGDILQKGDEIANFRAKGNTILQCERVMLNILQHSSGIATYTNQFIKQADGLKVLDTRKTRPLLREFEKYSVRIGGGTNHRMGLDDALMIKDTHLATIKNLQEFVQKARTKIPWSSNIECECQTLEIAKKAFEAKVDIVMCDNMSIFEIKEVVEIRNQNYTNIKVEASGNITLDSLKEYKRLGLDAVSTGSLVHQSRWLDFSMKIA